MKSILVLGLCAVFYLTTAAFGKEGTGAIEGLVLATDTNTPLRNAVVTLSGPFAATYLGMRDRPLSAATTLRAETDRNGHFVFSGLDTGNYEILAIRNGYAASNWSHETRATELVAVAAGQQVKDVVLKLEPAAVFTGTVWDPAGAPVQDATVRVLRRSYRESRTSHFILCPGIAHTDDRGEYRIAGVPSGSYQLRVTPPQSAKDSPQVYFPDTTDYRAAQWITVASREIRKIDFALRPGPVARVRGRVLAPDGKTLGDLTMGLNPREDGPSDIVQAGFQVSAFQGRFEIAGVPPGSYILSAADKGQKFAAIQELEVRDDMDGVFVKLAPAHQGRGVVYVEGGGAPALKGIAVMLLPLDLPCCTPRATVQEDATFAFDSLMPLHYAIAVDSLPPGYYVRSIRLGGKEVGGAGFAVESDASFTIALASGGARLAGAVVDATGKPVAYAEVTLIPVDAGIPTARNALANAQGNFSFDAVAPGRYKVLAWETPEDARYLRAQDSDVLAPFAARASSVTLADGERQTVTLTLIPAVESRKLVAPR
ncbi:MAG: carboxypeptidase regulatory-like domain-containing protein [Bryobacteraceae bacterium]